MDGEHVLVSGGSGGIGLACVRGFVREGCKVTLVARDAGRLARAQETLESADAGVYAADLADSADAAAVLERIEDERGPVGVLVNAAGAPRRTPFDQLQGADWLDAMHAKFLPCVNLMTPMAARMGARGRGAIVNVVGLGGKTPTPINLPGGAANAALMLATAGMASAWGPRGVRINAVNPALTATELLDDYVRAQASASGVPKDAVMEALVARLPLGRAATPDEVADTVVWLASPRASYVSGAILSVDGAASAMVV